jgi:uncharacterized protein (TIGR03435 family)
MEPAKEGEGDDEEGRVYSQLLQQNRVEMKGDHATMLQLCDHLQRLLHSSVFDQTGLTGQYNFKIRYAKDEAPQDFAAIVDAIKQIGLKVEQYKEPVESWQSTGSRRRHGKLTWACAPTSSNPPRSPAPCGWRRSRYGA